MRATMWTSGRLLLNRETGMDRWEKERMGIVARGFSRGAGFTLIELMIAMVVGLLLLFAINGVFTIQSQTFNVQEEIVAMQQNVRAGMDMMGREIGMAGYDPARADNFSGITISGTQLQIQADLNGDGTIDATSQENIIYVYDSANKRITRNIGSGAQPFLENIDAFTFTYLDGSGNVTTTAANVRQVRITITGRTAKPDPKYTSNDGYRTFSLTSVTHTRNLAY
jgi:type IV pilus assembly protein PilW